MVGDEYGFVYTTFLRTCPRGNRPMVPFALPSSLAVQQCDSREDAVLSKRGFVIAVAALVLCLSALLAVRPPIFASSVGTPASVTHNFMAGDPALAAEVNLNFQDVVDQLELLRAAINDNDTRIAGSGDAEIPVQTRFLSAFQSVDGYLGDLTFDNLELGCFYRISGQIVTINKSIANWGVNFVHDGQTIGKAVVANEGSGGETFAVSPNILFQATGSDLKFLAYNLTPNGGVYGNGTREETYISLEKLPNHVASQPALPFSQDSYDATLTFAAQLSGAANSVAWDGTNLWEAVSSAAVDQNFARHDAAGAFLESFATGRNPRSIYTLGDGTSPVYLRGLSQLTQRVQNPPGSGTFVTDLTLQNDPSSRLIGSPGDQASVVYDATRDHFVAMVEGNLLRWDAGGSFLAEIPLSGFGSMNSENTYPANRGVATSNGYYLTYSSGVLSAWDDTGSRMDTTILNGAGTTFNSHFSLSYAQGKVWVIDLAGGTWRGYDVGF